MKNRWLLAVLLALVPAAYGAQRIGTLPSYNWPQDAGKMLGIGASGSSGSGAFALKFGSNSDINVRDFGAIPDDGIDDAVAINAAIGSVGTSGSPNGVRVFIPRGTYDLTTGPIRLNRETVLFGENGAGRASSTIIKPNKRYSGIVVERATTSSDGGQGDWTIIRDISIQYATQATADWQATHAYVVGDLVRSLVTGSGVNAVAGPNWNPGVLFRCTGAGTSGGSEPSWASKVEGDTVSDGGVTWTAVVIAGVRMRGRAKLENFYISNASGNGVRVDGSSGSTPSTNANGWRMEYGRIETAGLDGVYIVGEDSNAGLSSGVDISSCGYWCLDDTSFLGNTHDGDEAANCILGPYRNSNANASSLYTGCYSESGQPPSNIRHPSTMYGGTHGAGFVENTGFNGGRMVANRLSGNWDILSGNGSGGYTNTLITADNDPSLFFRYIGKDTSQVNISGVDLMWRYTRSGYTSGFFRADISGGDSAIAYLIATTQQATYPAASFLTPGGLVLGGDTLGYGGPRLTAENAQHPITGTHRTGDLTFSSAPSGPFAYQCTSGGTPGSWTPIGGPHTSTTGDLLSFAGTGGLQWSDSGVLAANVVQVSRNVTAGTGLTGGGALTSDITLSASFGTTSTTVCVGNDSRLSDSRAPTGTAGGELSGTYPNPTVAKLIGVTLPTSNIANGFLKLNSGNTAWEEVAYGTSSDTVCQGNDSRLPASAAMSTKLTALDAYESVTSNAVGSQGSATQLDATKRVHEITDNNSSGGVILPTGSTVVAGETHWIYVSGTTPKRIFPGVGDKYSQLSTNAQFNLQIFTMAKVNAKSVSGGVVTWDFALEPMSDDADRMVMKHNVTFKGATINFDSNSGSPTFGNGFTSQWTTAFTANVGFTLPSILTPSGTTQTVSWASGVTQKLSLASASGDVTLTLSNPVDGGRYKLVILQGASSRNVVWPVNVKWPGGTAPTITATNGKVDVVSLDYVLGVDVYYGQFAQNF